MRTSVPFALCYAKLSAISLRSLPTNEMLLLINLFSIDICPQSNELKIGTYTFLNMALIILSSEKMSRYERRRRFMLQTVLFTVINFVRLEKLICVLFKVIRLCNI